MNVLFWSGWFFSRVFGWVVFGLRRFGAENIPKKGPLIIALNHHSYFDPPLIGAKVNRELHFFAKSELFEVFFLGRLIRKVNAIPVRRGTFDPRALRSVEKVLSNNGALMVFPEGTRNNGVDFLPPKPGIGLIAKRAGVPIVPAYAYGLKSPAQAFFRRRSARVYFGPPIPVEQLEQFSDNKDGYRSLAEFVMEKIARLKAEAVSS
jgi:1-acyl-sn-glycerol-3-phosphate acyltransferase